MSSQEVNSSTATTTPQHSSITSTTSEDDSQNNLPDQAEASNETIDASLTEANAEQRLDNASVSTESDSLVVRSESVIKSTSKPLFVTSSTPVIKVVDSSQEISEKDSNNDVKRAIGTSVIAQPSSGASQTSFLHSTSNPSPSNPFLRTSSFSAGISSSSHDNSDPNSDSASIFAPPKLFAPFSGSNLFDTSASFQRPSVLRAADSNNEGVFFSSLFCLH